MRERSTCAVLSGASVLPCHKDSADSVHRFIMGSAAEALEDLDFSTNLNHDDVQTWVKKASVHMELGDSTAAMNDFETAIKVDPDNADMCASLIYSWDLRAEYNHSYYHRGQVYFIQQQYSKAIEEYKKSTALDNTFIFSQIQHAVALYKDGSKERAVQRFKKCLNAFGATSGEVHKCVIIAQYMRKTEIS